MTIKRLKETDATVIKIRQLEKLAFELGITFTYLTYGGFAVEDITRPDVIMRYMDNEGNWNRDTVDSFPHCLETKVCFDDRDTFTLS